MLEQSVWGIRKSEGARDRCAQRTCCGVSGKLEHGEGEDSERAMKRGAVARRKTHSSPNSSLELA